MTSTKYLAEAQRYSRPYRVDKGARFRLADVDPDDTRDLRSKTDAAELLAHGRETLAELQSILYAQDRWALLLIFQAMDAAGKDSTIKHVMTGINPMGCQVFAFKAPSPQELDHDFMWRTTIALPERGRIGIFNRSYYEEVLVVRVHPEILNNERLPQTLVTKKIWAQRFEDINNFERYLGRNGVVVRKFFLHVSKEEQRRRFLERLDQPDKRWKFSLRDVEEREHWDQYMHAYEDMVRNTATADAPWYVIPADHKWFTRVAVAGAVIDALASLDLQFPKLPPAKEQELAAARRALGPPAPQRRKGRKRS
jgi:PPK2 family polyphosphate:nucleotide phosphotransferase